MKICEEKLMTWIWFVEAWKSMCIYVCTYMLEVLINFKMLDAGNLWQICSNKFYQQIDRCAMGSPTSSTIPQLVIQYVQEKNNKTVNP